MIENLVRKLEKFQFEYKTTDKSITIKLGLKQVVKITLQENEEIKFEDKIMAGSFLTGVLPYSRSLRTIMIVQSIANTMAPLMLLSLFFFLGLKDAEYIAIVVLMSILMWAITLYWTMYYHIKAESFKRTVISWLDD